MKGRSEAVCKKREEGEECSRWRELGVEMGERVVLSGKSVYLAETGWQDPKGDA